MLYGIQQVNKFKSKKSKLRKLVYECIDDILTDIIMHDAFEYVTIPYVLKDNKCLDVYIYVIAIITMIHLLMVFQQID